MFSYFDGFAEATSSSTKDDNGATSSSNDADTTFSSFDASAEAKSSPLDDNPDTTSSSSYGSAGWLLFICSNLALVEIATLGEKSNAMER